MRFARPEFLHLFILIFIISAFAFWKLKQGFRIRKNWENSKLKNISRFSSKARKVLVYCLIILTVSLAILALSQPQISSEKPITKQNFDILCFIDESKSTDTMDVLFQGEKVFRLDLIREELKNFIKNYIGKDKNCMALIVFGPRAIPRTYFTFDAAPLLSFADNLNTEDFPPEGTDIGEAILTGIDMLDTIDAKPEVFGRRKNKRIFILISDGEDFGNTLDQAITEVRGKRIPVYTIGVGSKQGGYIMEKTEDDKLAYFIDDETGEKISSKLEEETLKKLAQASRGKYVHSQTGEELTKAFKDALEREAMREGKTEKVYQDIYQYFLYAAFVLCLLTIILYI